MIQINLSKTNSFNADHSYVPVLFPQFTQLWLLDFCFALFKAFWQFKPFRVLFYAQFTEDWVKSDAGEKIISQRNIYNQRWKQIYFIDANCI